MFGVKRIQGDNQRDFKANCLLRIIRRALSELNPTANAAKHCPQPCHVYLNVSEGPHNDCIIPADSIIERGGLNKMAVEPISTQSDSQRDFKQNCLLRIAFRYRKHGQELRVEIRGSSLRDSLRTQKPRQEVGYKRISRYIHKVLHIWWL